MHSVNRIFTLFVVLAAFASARSFGGEFTPMTTLFDSADVQQTSNSSTQAVLPTVQPLPSRPEDIQFPEPADDVDLKLIPAPSVEKKETRNVKPAKSIEQVGFYLPEQNVIPPAPRSTLPDPSINDPNFNYQINKKPVKVYSNAIAATPQPTSVPADVKAIVETPVTAPVANPFAQEPAVRTVGGVSNVTTSLPPLSQAAPMEPIVEGSNPQMFREDFDYQQFRSEMIGEIDKHAWTSGDFQIIPYAKLWASMSYETKPTQIGSAPFFVT
ncbi:MAG: hypothetical protein IKS45_09760, partial [Thermoguttaceae bacterium]|nr:hypothetical protein [Thermoguttaceae bacterium]